MDKKNREPLVKPPQIMPKEVVPEGSIYRPASDEPAAQPEDLKAALHKGTSQIEEGVDKGSLEDIQKGTRITTNLINIASGADPMRPPREQVPNGDAVPGAMEEVERFLATLKDENPGVIRRLDMERLGEAMAGYEHASTMQEIYQSGDRQMDALKRYYLGEAAPTLIALHQGCRTTIETHADLKGKMPELTRLAVGTGVDAAASKVSNDKVWAQGWEAGTAAAHAHGGTPEKPAPPATTTTVTTPAPGVTPPPVTPPTHAPAHRPPRSPAPKG